MNKPMSGSKAPSRDIFQTPPYALDPLIPWLRTKHKQVLILEPACGKGNLVNKLNEQPNITCIGKDIETGTDFRNFEILTGYGIDFIVTNPPYSIANEFIEKCIRHYKQGEIKGFALLLPVNFIDSQARQAMWRTVKLEIIMLGRRINFETPTGKTEGNGSCAQIETAWFTVGLDIERQNQFIESFYGVWMQLPKKEK